MYVMYQIEGHPDSGGGEHRGRHFEVLLPREKWVETMRKQEKKAAADNVKQAEQRASQAKEFAKYQAVSPSPALVTVPMLPLARASLDRAQVQADAPQPLTQVLTLVPTSLLTLLLVHRLMTSEPSRWRRRRRSSPSPRLRAPLQHFSQWRRRLGPLGHEREKSV